MLVYDIRPVFYALQGVPLFETIQARNYFDRSTPLLHIERETTGTLIFNSIRLDPDPVNVNKNPEI